MPFLHFFLSLFILLPVSLAAQPRPGVEHVLVIGVDGLSPDGIRQSNTPTLDSLMQQGVATVAYLLGATPPDCWVGRPITSIETSEGYATQPQN